MLLMAAPRPEPKRPGSAQRHQGNNAPLSKAAKAISVRGDRVLAIAIQVQPDVFEIGAERAIDA